MEKCIYCGMDMEEPMVSDGGDSEGRDNLEVEHHDENGTICLIRQALNNRDREWFQIIESILGFHPVSTTEALNKGIAKIRELRKEKREKDGC
jgi:hypothetical protein